VNEIQSKPHDEGNAKGGKNKRLIMGSEVLLYDYRWTPGRRKTRDTWKVENGEAQKALWSRTKNGLRRMWPENKGCWKPGMDAVQKNSSDKSLDVFSDGL